MISHFIAEFILSKLPQDMDKTTRRLWFLIVVLLIVGIIGWIRTERRMA